MDQSVSGTANNALNYTGREQDSNNLYYYRARYYDPEIGRFLSEDPLGFEAGVNFYAYVNNNPVNFNDPFGKEGFPACPGCLIPVEFFQEAGRQIEEFVDGAISYPVGIYRAGDFATQYIGLQGQQAQANAELNLAIFNELASQAWQHPDVAYDLAANYVSENPARIAGRLATPAVLGYITKRPDVVAGLSSAAAFGDAIYAIDQGVDSLRGLIPAAVGGEIQIDVEVEIRLRSSGASQLFNDPLSNVLGSSVAGGGFVLYPNRLNMNMLQSVYNK